MILRYAHSSTTDSAPDKPVRTGASLFFASQESREPPQGLVLQVVHSSLAGQLARHLLPGVFGPLPNEVIDAAEKHDLGWRESDAKQLTRFPETRPKPFPRVPEDELPSWERSLRISEAFAPLTHLMIRRHFSALAQSPNPRHETFLALEAARTNELEHALGIAREDLKGWTGAVGFCDLLSLYLCSGIKESATFPLAHPAEPDARSAPQVVLTWQGDKPVFSERLFAPEAQVRIEWQRFDVVNRNLKTCLSSWQL